MFGDIDKLKEMREKLNSVSPSFCLAKWMHVSIHLLSGHTHSCYLPNTHKIPLDEIKRNPSALHNTRYKKEQRKKMLEGERPEECGICWSIEDLPGGQTSDRHYRGVDSWTMPFFDKVKNLPWDADINPTYVEVSFSNLCNFKCSYCSPHVSSTWMAEIEKHGPYKLASGQFQNTDWLVRQGRLPIPEDQPNPYVDAFWKWWPELAKTLMFFRITGGEPLLSRHTFRVLDWLDQNPQPSLELSLNSNLGIPDNYFERFLAAVKSLLAGGKIKGFMLHTSIDAYGAQAEYIRHGLVFTQFERNLDRYLTELPSAQVAFMCTFNNLSVGGFRPFLEWVLEVRRKYNSNQRSVLLDIPHLQGPAHQSAKILTPRYSKMMEEHIIFMKDHGFSQAEIDKMGRILEWMRSPSDQKWMELSRSDFYLYFKEHDRRRGTDFLSTFPEMKDFWNECKALINA
ncbi:MAG: twitch domain-containing radical SAM protein [Deltaproteobacteria bacterium]|nr:twitch domain-containing radical SAM protein [Deltaproteobacteria bacterium]